MKLFIDMRIIVTTFKSINGDRHRIEVVDGSGTIHTEIVQTIKQRDGAVWDLAETYNVVDINITGGVVEEANIPDNFMFSEIPTIPVLDEEDAHLFFDQSSDFVYSRIVQAIGEGISKDLHEVRLFELNGTEFYLTAKRCEWKAGLQQAIDYYVSVEKYEECIDIQKMLGKL